jgi:hypothetical protein
VKNTNALARSLVLALVLVGCLAAIGTAGETKPAPKASKPAKKLRQDAAPMVQMTLEPKAIELLKAASARLAAARTLSFTAVVSYESASRLGIPLVYTIRSEVTLQRPDKLRVITPGDGPASEFYYDGKTMTAFAPAENLVAVAEAPPTIDAALKAAYDSAAMYFPFANIMAADPYAKISEGLASAFYIGQSHEVGGTTTDMVAYVNDNVLLQAWIGAEDNLPRRVRAAYRTDLAHSRNQIDFSNWQLDLAVPAEAFASASAGGANHIAFAHPNPQTLPYAKPPAKRKASTAKSTTK